MFYRNIVFIVCKLLAHDVYRFTVDGQVAHFVLEDSCCCCFSGTRLSTSSGPQSHLPGRFFNHRLAIACQQLQGLLSSAKPPVCQHQLKSFRFHKLESHRLWHLIIVQQCPSRYTRECREYGATISHDTSMRKLYESMSLMRLISAAKTSRVWALRLEILGDITVEQQPTVI